MRILYISSLLSLQREKELNNVFKGKLLNMQAQKFHSLITRGLLENNVIVDHLTTCSQPPKLAKKKYIKGSRQTSGGMKYYNTPILFIPILQFIFSFLHTFFFVLKWIFNNKKEEKVIVCDVTEVFYSLGALVASKFMRIKIVSLVTDLPGNLVGNNMEKKSIKKVVIYFYREFTEFFCNWFDYYILLTPQMNDIVNLKKKPFIVIEGVVDNQFIINEHNFNDKYDKKVILFAGQLEKIHGIHLLVEGFMRTKSSDYELHLYGKGGAEEFIKNMATLDSRIKFFGLQPNELIVKEEVRATILVNPRLTNQDFVKYSFPSKNMEYMASGTALLTTKLPGMPEEYNKYVYLLEDESAVGMEEAINDLFSKSNEELNGIGMKARLFVLENKNSFVQTQKIKEMIS